MTPPASNISTCRGESACRWAMLPPPAQLVAPRHRRVDGAAWIFLARLATHLRLGGRSVSVHAGCFNAVASIGSFRSRLPVAAKIAFVANVVVLCRSREPAHVHVVDQTLTPWPDGGSTN